MGKVFEFLSWLPQYYVREYSLITYNINALREEEDSIKKRLSLHKYAQKKNKKIGRLLFKDFSCLVHTLLKSHY